MGGDLLHGLDLGAISTRAEPAAAGRSEGMHLDKQGAQILVKHEGPRNTHEGSCWVHVPPQQGNYLAPDLQLSECRSFISYTNDDRMAIIYVTYQPYLYVCT